MKSKTLKKIKDIKYYFDSYKIILIIMLELVPPTFFGTML